MTSHDNVTDIELIIHRIGLRSHNGADLDRLVVAVPALLTDLATLRKQLENAREALVKNQWELETIDRTQSTNFRRVQELILANREALKGQPC